MMYLRTPAQIKSQLIKLFAERGEKWAIVAFVGYGALDQLPTAPDQLSVVCWPKAGATHPDGVRRLIGAGVRVFFCENLHSKIFWRKGCGLIIGSANLSKNALGSTKQHEFAVYVDDKSIDIKTVLEELSYTEVTSEALHKLDVEHVVAVTRDADSDTGEGRTPTFLKSRQEPMPKRWGIVEWHEHRDGDASICNAVVEHTGRERWENDNDVENGNYEKGDFVLQISVINNEDGGKAGPHNSDRMTRPNGRWLRVDLIAKVDGSTAVVQIEPNKHGPSPPFKIDEKFKVAFKEVFNRSGWANTVDSSGYVLEKFNKELEVAYRGA